MGREELVADCARCVGLCCVVPALAKSSDFAITKPASHPCKNLLADHRCSIHADLDVKGFPGCTVYDCFGAGQQVTQVTFGGVSWRDDVRIRPQMFAAFEVMRALHELLWLVADAIALGGLELTAKLEDERDLLTALSRLPARELVGTNVEVHRARVNLLLTAVSTAVRAMVRAEAADHRGADLIGRDLRGVDLTAASLRGALLVGADLRGARLASADLTGADLRGADVRGTDLSGALFLSQQQLNATRGDHATTAPAHLTRPPRWGSTVG